MAVRLLGHGADSACAPPLTVRGDADAGRDGAGTLEETPLQLRRTPVSARTDTGHFCYASPSDYRAEDEMRRGARRPLLGHHPGRRVVWPTGGGSRCRCRGLACAASPRGAHHCRPAVAAGSRSRKTTSLMRSSSWPTASGARRGSASRPRRRSRTSAALHGTNGAGAGGAAHGRPMWEPRRVVRAGRRIAIGGWGTTAQ